MSSKYSPEFKAKIALEAASLKVSQLSELAKKHDLEESTILAWVKELNEKAPNLFNSGDSEHGSHHHAAKGEDVTLETSDDNLVSSVSFGAQGDILNYNRLIYWSVLGTVLVIVMVVGLVQFSEFSVFKAQERVSGQTVPFDLTRLQSQQKETLNSYGVVDLEAGIYRIPIDSAITKIAKD